MSETSRKKQTHDRKERNPSCTLCINHGVRSKFKGHKRLGCPFLSCHCELCVNGRQKRVTMKKQVRLRRKQMKDIGRRNNQCISPAVEPTRGNRTIFMCCFSFHRMSFSFGVNQALSLCIFMSTVKTVRESSAFGFVYLDLSWPFK